MREIIRFIKRFVPEDGLRDIVKKLAVVDTPRDVITDVINDAYREMNRGVTTETITTQELEEIFRAELRHSTYVAKANVAGKLYESAMDGHVPSQMFWMKYIGNHEPDNEMDDRNVVLMDPDIKCDEWARRQYERTKDFKPL